MPDLSTVGRTEFADLTVGTGNVTYTAPRAGAISRKLQARLAEVVSILDFGGVADGVTDTTAAVVAAINALQTTGGTVYFPAGIYRIDGQILLPNDGGAGQPKQVSIRLVGDGAVKMNSPAGPSYSGTVLELRYSGPGVAKIDTRGSGFLGISHLSLRDLGGDSLPFLQSTNTTLDLDDVAFFGSKIGAACDQDCIVLGGTSTALDGTSNAAFQGYGTVIRDCWFDRIRRAVYIRTFGNGAQMIDNTIWAQSGTNLASGAAIEIEGTATDFSSGNLIAHNLIECPSYKYAVKITYGTQNTLIANNFYDPGATLAWVRCDTGADYNLIVVGFSVDTRPQLSEAGGATNTLLTGHQSQESRFAQPARFLNNLFVKNNSGPFVYDMGDNRWFPQISGAAGAALDWVYLLSGGANEAVARLSRTSSAVYEIQIRNVTTNRLVTFGSLGLRSATGNIVSIGDATDEHTIQSGHLAIKKHLNRQSVSDLSGTAQVNSGATTAVVTFQTAYGSAPAVVLTPQSDPGSRFWVVTTTTGFTVTMQTAPGGNVVFKWLAIGNPS